MSFQNSRRSAGTPAYSKKQSLTASSISRGKDIPRGGRRGRAYGRRFFFPSRERRRAMVFGSARPSIGLATTAAQPAALAFASRFFESDAVTATTGIDRVRGSALI